MKKWIGCALILVGVFLMAIGASLWWFRKTPLLSPITTDSIFRFLTQAPPPAGPPKVVYGFLPYWNVDKVAVQPELTHLAYFSLTIGPNGKILTTNTDGSGTVDPGYDKLKSDQLLTIMNQAKKNNAKVDLVFAQMSNDDISNFLLNEPAQQTFFQSLDSILLAYPVDGINIDMEYGGSVPPKVRDRFTQFITELHDHLQKKYTGIELSVDVYVSAAHDDQLWDLQQVSPVVDSVIIMAYDFSRRSSIIAGPVSPLFGGQQFWSDDITTYLKQLLSVVPPSKLLLGIPFYGNEWQTTSRDPQATTYPDTGATATYQHIQDLLAQKEQLNVQENWNDAALVPYLSYQKNGQTYVVYYENSRSLSYKLDLVNQLELKGIAIWALGYESNSRELWDVINHKFKTGG